ncbi:hypothetical protein OJ252_124 [Cryptosporidium canis]|uniref:Protein kinase domain-containing protein n=1 Tax=Cryptosporidium canis TaxID=195482 RepID=A0ABQ8PBU1_9CRYT|nr:hypothetical protein OJ252_124 [Cryptosporidium canis]
MLIRIGSPCRDIWLVACIALLFAISFTADADYDIQSHSNIELCFLRFIGKVRLCNGGSSSSKLANTSANTLQHPLISSVTNLNDTVKSDLELSSKIALRANISNSEKSEVRAEIEHSYTSLLSLLLGKERFSLVKQTIKNELNLYSYIKAFPRRIENIEKHLQLYTICSYLSPIISCEIKEVFNNNLTLSDGYNSTSSSCNPKYREVNFPMTFPWVSSGYKWNIISGTYGDVICGKVFGGNKNIFPHNQDSASFFFSTYKNFKSKEYSAFILVSKAHEASPRYKQLEAGKNIHVCIKSFRSVNHPDYFKIWEDENFNLKWLERDTWISNLPDYKYIKLTPSQVFIAPKISQGSSHKGNPFVTHLNEKSTHTCVSNCESSIFYPSIYESHYPWNTVSSKFWSSYLLMEQFIGPSFSDISNFLVLDSVIAWTKLSSDNLYLWSVSLIHVAYLFFSALISFTFTGSLLYQHCDLHANNLILLSDKWEITDNDSFSIPKAHVSLQEAISEIVLSNIRSVKIIDLTYITHISDKRRSSNQLCETYGEVSISDVENWQVFLYNLKKDVDDALSKHKDIPQTANSLSTLIKLFENDVDFNLTKPKYIGGSELWWKNWSFNQNKFDDLYNSVMGIGNLFSEAISLVESSIFQNSDITLFGPPKSQFSKNVPSPITFEAYFKELFYVPYSILSFGTCIYQHEIIGKNQTMYFLVAAETLSHYFLINFQNESEKLPSWLHKDQVGSRLLWNKCIQSNSLFAKTISEEFPTKFYYEPCFAEYCISKKKFSDKIKGWIQEDIQDRSFFTNSLKKLIMLSTNKINFALSILVLNQIKYNVKEPLLESYEKLSQISTTFSKSVSDYLINELHKEKSVQGIQAFLSFCMEEYYKHLILFIDLSTFNFGEKLCSKINKAVFTHFIIHE